MILESESGYRTFSLSVEDYDKLVARFSQSVPFEGTSGKYAFHQSILYPRYKIRTIFEKHNSVNVSKRSIAKNYSYADYMVVSLKDILEILRGGSKTMITNRVVFRYLYTKQYGILSTAINLFSLGESTGREIPLIDINDFLKGTDFTKERLSIPNAEFIIDLMKGDKASQKLGMETMSNFDLRKSIAAILYITLKGGVGKYNDYWHSTAFKSFREQFSRFVGRHIDSLPSMTSDPLVNVYDYLTDLQEAKKEFSITASEALMLRAACHKFICEKSSENYSIDIELPIESVSLRINPEFIIADEVVEAEDAMRQQALIEEGADAYILVDDTDLST